MRLEKPCDYEYSGCHLSIETHGKPIAVYGRDGEKGLAAGLAKMESSATSVHLLCMFHAKENVKKKIQDLQVSSQTQQKIIKHIYEKDINRVRHTGLVDAESTHHMALDHLQPPQRCTAIHCECLY